MLNLMLNFIYFISDKITITATIILPLVYALVVTAPAATIIITIYNYSFYV